MYYRAWIVKERLDNGVIACRRTVYEVKCEMWEKCEKSASRFLVSLDLYIVAEQRQRSLCESDREGAV